MNTVREYEGKSETLRQLTGAQSSLYRNVFGYHHYILYAVKIVQSENRISLIFIAYLTSSMCNPTDMSLINKQLLKLSWGHWRYRSGKQQMQQSKISDLKKLLHPVTNNLEIITEWGEGRMLW